MMSQVTTHRYAFLALFSLALGSILHYNTSSGILRNHGSDFLWALFGILAFRAIWNHGKYTWVPIIIAILWEFIELRIPRATFDPKDISIYIILMLIPLRSQWLKHRNRKYNSEHDL